MSEFLNPDFASKRIYWRGIVQPSESWQDNIESELFSKAEQQKGWNYRYRVRIIGWHTGDTKLVPSDLCIMAIVKLPVTAGSGLGGFHDTPALSAGSHVDGYFDDGPNAQIGVIDGVFINSNNNVPKKQSDSPVGGFDLANNTYKEGPPETGAFVPTNLIGTQEFWKVIQSIGDKVNLGDGAVQAWTEQDLDRKKPTPLASPCKTDNSPFKGIQTTIQNLLNEIQNYDTIAEIFGGGDPDREGFIQKVLDIASGDIAGYVKSLFDSIRGYAYNAISDAAKKIVPFLFPTEVPNFTKKVNEGNNLLSCLFNKLVRQLPGLISGILSGLLDKLIDTAFCFAESFVSDLLNKFGILDQITNAVKAAIALFSQGVDLVTGILGSVFNALDFANGILNFFKCDDDAACPQQGEIDLAGTLLKGGDNFVPVNNLEGVFTSNQSGGNSSVAVNFQI
jgi:hypothetical protein